MFMLLELKGEKDNLPRNKILFLLMKDIYT